MNVQLIIAGDDAQARACAELRGLGPGDWKQVTSENDLRGSVPMKGKTVLLYGSYRWRWVLVWREWQRIILSRGGITEEVVDARLT